MNYFKSNLLHLLDKNNLSKSELARKMNVTKQAMTTLFKTENPQANTLIVLSEIFKISIDDLLKKDLSNEQKEDRKWLQNHSWKNMI